MPATCTSPCRRRCHQGRQCPQTLTAAKRVVALDVALLRLVERLLHQVVPPGPSA